MRRYGFRHTPASGALTVMELEHMSKQYNGFKVEGIVPAPDGAPVGHYVFFSFIEEKPNE